MIYRLTLQADWQRAQRDAMFVSEDLANEGFIHCSERHQILRIANKYFAQATGLLVLEIDEVALGDKLRREDLAGSGIFPHVYGEIPIIAVAAVHLLEHNEATGWQLPPSLAG